MSIAYEWRRCNGGVCSNIASANTPGYLLTSEDIGARLQVSVTASNSAGSATAASTETAVVTSQPGILPPASAPVWSADHETGDASQWPQITAGWDDAGCVEHAVVADGHAQSGSYSMKMTIDGSGLPRAACRQARLLEIRTQNTYIYEVSYFLPEPVLTLSNHWNVFQFKSKRSSDPGSDPMWTIDFQGDPLRPVLAWQGGNFGLQGPFVDSGIAFKEWPNDLTTVPIGRWTTLTVLLDQSAEHDGAIKVWHDGTLIYDFANVRTEYPNLAPQWAVGNYSNGLTVNPYTLYLDDASIYAP
jgi:hypothetical protein